MYDELVKRLRNRRICIQQSNGLNDFPLLGEAADAIGELQAHYCPHMIRNVHDRGDDSLCRVLRTEPPKEET